jgi:hypothetical protein
MLNALLLLIAAGPLQDRAEKIPLQHVSAQAAYKRLTRPPGLPTGVTHVVYDPTDNSIIVRGSEKGIEALRRDLKKFDVAQQTRVVQVKHVSAQYLYELITMTGRFADETAGKGFVPDGVKLVVDATTNSIVAAGPEDGVRETELLLQQMDGPPRPLTIEVKGSIPSISRSIATKSEVVNNSTLTVDDGSSDTSLTIRPRVNGDGSVTVSVRGTVYGSTWSFVYRLRPGETYYVREVPRGISAGTPRFVTSFYREVPINEEAFLSGEPMSTLGPEFEDDTSRALNGELRLIFRVHVPKEQPDNRGS